MFVHQTLARALMLLALGFGFMIGMMVGALVENGDVAGTLFIACGVLLIIIMVWIGWMIREDS